MNRISTLAILSGLSMIAATAQAQQVVVYNQMQHMALGDAKLSVSPNGKFMRAANLGPSGTDGFRTRLPDHADSWSAEFIVDLDSGDTLSFNPISEGLAIAPLEVTGTADGFNAKVEFTSSDNPSYVIKIRDAGDLVATWTCVPGGECEPGDDGPGGYVPGPGGIFIDFEPLPDPDVDEPTLFEDRFNQDQEGNCGHIMGTTATAAVYVGGQHLGDGDQVAVFENAEQATARYPYAGFNVMQVQSSADQIVLIDESSR